MPRLAPVIKSVLPFSMASKVKRLVTFVDRTPHHEWNRLFTECCSLLACWAQEQWTLYWRSMHMIQRQRAVSWLEAVRAPDSLVLTVRQYLLGFIDPKIDLFVQALQKYMHLRRYAWFLLCEAVTDTACEIFELIVGLALVNHKLRCALARSRGRWRWSCSLGKWHAYLCLYTRSGQHSGDLAGNPWTVTVFSSRLSSLQRRLRSLKPPWISGLHSSVYFQLFVIWLARRCELHGGLVWTQLIHIQPNRYRLFCRAGIGLLYTTSSVYQLLRGSIMWVCVSVCVL